MLSPSKVEFSQERCFEISGFPAEANPENIIKWLNDACDVAVDINDLKETEFSGRFIIQNLNRKERRAATSKIRGKLFLDEEIFVNTWTPKTPEKIEEITIGSSDSE